MNSPSKGNFSATSLGMDGYYALSVPLKPFPVREGQSHLVMQFPLAPSEVGDATVLSYPSIAIYPLFFDF